MRKSKQLSLQLPHRGGKRAGAGRKPKGPRPLVSHKARPKFEKPAAVHVTLRMATQVWNLRSRRCFRTIESCFEDARERFGLRIIELSVMGNHLHVLVEADNNLGLSRGMQALGVRIARRLNRLMGRRGAVFADHYHSHLLGSPSQLVNATAYVLGNAAHHYGTQGIDSFCSSAYDHEKRDRVLSQPQTWLLKTGWRRARRIPLVLQALWGSDVHVPAPSDDSSSYDPRHLRGIATA
jgi:REP element-mobilizing transposase RayT